MFSRFLSLAGLVFLMSACVSKPQPSPDFPVADWQTQATTDSSYILWSGDTLDISVTTAPELSREDVIIAPDGRVQMPFIGSVLAAGRTIDEFRTELSAQLSSELRDPRVFVAATDYGSQQIFVNGEVTAPGVFTLPGQIGPLQAIAMAGGLTPRADAKQVILIRRVPGGELKSAVYNIKKGILDPLAANWGPLERFDVIHVSPTWIAKENQFVQQYVRDALPVNFSLFFDLAGSGVF